MMARAKLSNHTDDWRATVVRVSAFWLNVSRLGDDECWPWTGSMDNDGYGIFFFGGGLVGAHELAVTFTTGEVRLPELDTCHRCGNRICCNPGHLRFDTRLSNVADTIRMGRNHRAVRIADETVNLIRRRRQAGAAQEDLAVQYGLSSAYVSLIVNGHVRISAGGPIANGRRYHRRSA